MTTSLSRLSLLALPLLLTACPAPDPEELCDVDPQRAVDGADPEVAAVVDGNAAFALDLHRHLAAGGGNVFTSPFSISAALAMTYAGARGATATEMHDTLQVGLEDARFHEVFGGLLTDLDQPADSCFSYQFSVGNRLFGQVGFPFEADFVDLSGSAYGAPLQDVDFAGDLEGSRQIINQWVSDETRGVIPELFTSLHSDTVLVLANAVYFKGAWVDGFEPEDTADRPFHAPAGDVTVPMMARTGDLPYGEFNGFRAVKLPYEGDQISMLVILPDEDVALATVEADLDPEALRELTSGMGTTEVDLQLPRFELRQKRSLVEDLRALGMESLFSDADLSGISSQGGLYVSEVVHEAYIAVDESGTVAAAATGVEAGATSDGEGNSGEVHVDRPFLFLLVDDVTGSVLFLGRIEDPTGA